MDSPSTEADLHQKLLEAKRSLKLKHESELSFLKGLFEKQKQEIRDTNKVDLKQMEASMPSNVYHTHVLPIAEKALAYDLQQVEINHKKQIELTQKCHNEQLAKEEIAHHEKFTASLARTQHISPGSESGSIPQHNDVSTGPGGAGRHHQPTSLSSFANSNPVQLTKPLMCTVQRETVDGQSRLVMHIQSQPKKRRTSTHEETPSKRPHIDTSLDTSTNYLHTPVSPSLNEPSQQPERTISFDEVYQNGNAEHKDTIIAWPPNSKKWYIIKCEQHSLHFTQNPVAGAARHLNGVSHGFPDRNWDSAVRALGYRVVDCDEAQVRLHNGVVQKAYDNGYVPYGFRGSIENFRKKKSEEKAPKAPRPSHNTGTADSGSSQTKEAAAARSKPKKNEESGDAHGGITHPKTFHVYYGRWNGNKSKKVHIYPVLILGWDDQEGSGLKDTRLYDTKLLNKTSNPPSCYIYGSKKIIGWAPGYGDGGPKVGSRKFPVMFFDECQTVTWFPAADLLKFPLYKRKVPLRPNDPFNAARRWIAEREGFGSWEDREKARLRALQSSNPKTSAEGPHQDPNATASSDDSDDSSSESEAESTASEETEKMMKDLLEKEGENEGDDDYCTSTSDVDTGGIDSKNMDETLAFELEDWNRANPSLEMADKRPWAVYQLRGKESPPRQRQTESEKPIDDVIPEVLKSPLSTVPYPSSEKASSKGTLDNRGEKQRSAPAAPDSSIVGSASTVNVEQPVGEDSRETRSATVQWPEPAVANRFPTAAASNQTSTSPSETVAHGLSKESTALAEISAAPKAISDETTDASHDYELSQFSDELVSWTRSKENEGCIGLVYSTDRQRITTTGSRIQATIDAAEITAFSRQDSTVLILKKKDGSTWKLGFDRNREDKMQNGKLQSRKFVRWLQGLGLGIKCLD
ncbi:hypothetical protein GGR52DRAFT_372827 [Hypoxylon sp. FL1284]|nr:hypothetical protein GGR52DRAFT_372827 [Hypoxylon sp. FL1284]